jgi:hypothetical protein
MFDVTHTLGLVERTAIKFAILSLGLAGCYEGADTHRDVPPGTRDTVAPVCTALTAKHSVPILVLSYLPSADGVNLDADVTGIDRPLDAMEAHVDDLTARTMDALQEGSRYRGYADRSAACSIDYVSIGHVKYIETLPRGLPLDNGGFRPDYDKVLQREDICKLVDEQGVREVWLWGWHHGDIVPAESNMAGPHGDISNSEKTDDMPVCKNSYVLYNYNYQRGVAEAVHNHGHQIENAMEYVDPKIFDEWRYRRTGGGPAGCGNVHTPPNGVGDYSYDSLNPGDSDCLDWRPDGSGESTVINCLEWGCDGDPQLQYLVWWMQNMPGLRNGLTRTDGNPVGNWWDAIADFDGVVEQGFQPESASEPEPEPGGSGPAAESSAQCDALGYDGTCLGATSVWSQDGACHVRDCASEGRECGFIGEDLGWGCLGGNEGHSTFECGEVGYTGACTTDDTLVWVEDGACNFVHCPDRGEACVWDDGIGYDCGMEGGAAAPESRAQCDALGYEGACVGDTSVWSQDGACHVRDCASESRACGWISDSVGWGCLGGTEGQTTIDCGDVGYTGLCTADDTLVWVQDGECRTSQCHERGLSCAWDDDLGYNCV